VRKRGAVASTSERVFSKLDLRRYYGRD